MRAAMVLATPVLPPDASAQAKSGMLVPGGAGGGIGGASILGAEAVLPGLDGLTAALGARAGPQAVRSTIKQRIGVRRTVQWYGRCSPERRGGGTGRRVGLKNRCPQGRASSTLALGTTQV